MLSWNCRGAAKIEFKRRIKDLKNQHAPSIMFILETKLSGQDAKEAAADCGFPCTHVVDSDGRAGGLWLLWDDAEVCVDVVTSTLQAIHAIVKVRSHPIFSKFHWFISGVYGRPQFEIRSLLWDELRKVAKYFNGPWLVIGDFNDVVDQVEKFGGAPVSQSRVRAYIDCMTDCNLMDIGYTGGRFTWVNMREGNHIIRERLDRAWANPDWRLQFPDANLLHLPRISSDHNPLLLYFDTPMCRIRNKPFRLEKFWLDHPEFHDLISPIWSTPNLCTSQCILNTQNSCKIWSKTTFDNIFVKKQELNARLDGIHRSLSHKPSNFLTNLEKELSLEYEKILKLEEDLWFMKSRTNWIVDGDRNSKFFHLSTIRHRNHNKIHCLRISDENWICDQDSIINLIRNHFIHLFTSSLDYSYHDSFSNLGVAVVEPHNLTFLDNPPTEKEIQDALFGLKPFKAPGPDGLHPGFFQRMWDSVRSTICSDIGNIFSSTSIPADWNECLITLIPKIKAPETVQQFRPIALCNTSYKIVSKILVNRIKPVLDTMISPCQASFIPGRKGIDNVLILQELVHSFSKRKGRVGDMVVKLDLEKAYDRLEWSFIREALTYFKFPPKFISLVMSCVSSTTISILVNGNRTDALLPSRGIRQGDPISPYLFILCMEYLSIKLTNDMAAGKWKGSKAGKRGPTLSHIFFADDLIFVGKATLTNAQYLKDTLDFFCARSGQMVNNAKSKILFSSNVDQNIRDNICYTLGYQQTNELGKYLGIPISAKRCSKANCQFILDKIRSKLSGWKTKFFSIAGRATLVSSVLASIPNYFMQVMWLPSSIHKEIDRISRNFLWGSVDSQRKIHLVDWNTICKPKAHGGLGFRSTRDANIVAMSKLNWRIHTEKENIWREVLVKKYNINDIHYTPPSSASPVLKNISKGTPLFISGIKWVPRNGSLVRFWSDHWVGKAALDSILFGPLIRNASNILLADVFQEGALDFDTIGYHIPQELAVQILAVPMSSSHSVADVISWKEESNGIFSSSSAYKILTINDCQANDDWKWVWKTPTLPKIQMFLWLLVHGRVKTLEYLHHLGIIDDPTCIICKREVESIDHIFRSCPHAVAIFNKLSPTFANILNIMDFKHWLFEHAHNNSPSHVFNIPWAVIFCFAIWILWNQRNQFLYCHQNVDVQRAHNLIIERATEFWASISTPAIRSKQGPKLISWEPPPPFWYKVNTDGSAVGNPGNAGCGGILRDYQGRWVVGFLRNIGHTTALAAELWAIKDGLSIAKSLQLQNVILETDCRVAYILLSDNLNPFHPHSTLLMDCRDLLRTIPQVQMKHVMRESNMAADAIAKKGALAPHGFHFLFDCPPDVELLCIADRVGVCYPRH
ncbi:hypothetical protein SLA2020_314490 [Shorea laevis]